MPANSPRLAAVSLLTLGLIGLGLAALVPLGSTSGTLPAVSDALPDGAAAAVRPLADDRTSSAQPGGFETSQRVPLPGSLQAAVSAVLEKDRYEIKRNDAHSPVPGSHRACNRAQGLQVGFSGNGIHLRPHGKAAASWELGMSLCGIGYGGLTQTTGEGRLTASGNRIDYQRVTATGVKFTEWYINSPKGLEQGFTIPKPPGARRNEKDPLLLEFAVSENLQAELAQDQRTIAFATTHGELAVRYSDLHAFDANGSELPSEMIVREGGIALCVDDTAATYPLTIDPLFLTDSKLYPLSEVPGGDHFGFSVALSGDTALVGAEGALGTTDHNGDVYVFVRSGATWTLQQKLTAKDSAIQYAHFGCSVALSADTALIGAYDASKDPWPNIVRSGAAYVFQRTGTTWEQKAKLMATKPAGGDKFGYSVALSEDGNTALVGAPRDDVDENNNCGSAWLFERADEGWKPHPTQPTLPASGLAPGDWFGHSVALSGDTALVGCPQDDDGYLNAGSAYVFVRKGTTWQKQDKLTEDDFQAAAYWNVFGWSVALDGDTALIGCMSGDDVVGRAGTAYVFVRNGTAWSPQQKLARSDPASNDAFGISVALNGDTALVGAIRANPGPRYLGPAGSAYVFVRSGTSWGESERMKLGARDPDPWSAFGSSVAVSGDTALVGVPYDDTLASEAGSAYVVDNLSSLTGEGPDVVVKPIDSTTGASPVTLTFDNVTEQGITTVTTSGTGAPPPSGFKLGNPPVYYEISTTAIFTGSVKICIDYSGISFRNESQIMLFHRLPNSGWEQLETCRDPEKDTVCASATSFSTFAILEPANQSPVAAMKLPAFDPIVGEVLTFDGRDS
ncbi:MAG: FG-GAP repeat protein, partial [Planctomycetota bacterium]